MRPHLLSKFFFVTAFLFPLSALASTVSPTVGTWQITKYDTMTAEGLLETQQISATGSVTKVRTNGMGRVRQTMDVLGNVSTAAYDNNGNLLSSRDANGVGQDCIYDQQNRKVSCTDTVGTATTIRYSLGGLVLNQQDGKFIWSAADATYDARGRMTSKTTRLDGSDKTLFTYDANGNRLTVTDGEGKVTRYEYDPRNLKTVWTFPGHQTGTTPGQPGYDKVTYEYDAAARLVAFNRQDGTRNENAYAFNGTLTSKQFKNALGIVTSADNFLYDINNRLVQAIKGRYGNTVGLAYDAVGRKASESLTVGGQTYTTQYGYDADNRNTSIVYPDGKTVARTYTQRNQLQSVSLNGQMILTSVTYDVGGRETQRTLGNGVQQSRTYRNDNLLIGMTTAGDQGSSVNYTYDSNKNLTAEQFQGVLAPFATALAQDAKDRLTQFTRTNGDTANWTLTKEGNWSNLTGSQGGQTINQARTHNDNHQITAITGTTTAAPTYDAQGDLTTDEQSRVYVWDQEKQLQGVVGGTTNVGYAYDAMGRRVSKTEGGNTTVYVSSGSQEIQEYNQGALVKTYVFGTYVDEVLAQQDNAGSNLYYITDRRHSTTALADQNGAIVERYAYDPYGKVTVLDAGGVVKASPTMTEILWTGRRLDSTGNYFFRSRYFSVPLGRFISRDVDYLDGWNLYAGYFANKYLVDPYGYGFWGWLGNTVIGAATGAITGAVSGAITGAVIGAVTGFVVGGPAGAIAGAAAGVAAGATAGAINGAIGGAIATNVGMAVGGTTAFNPGGAATSGAIAGGISGVISGVGSGIGAGIGQGGSSALTHYTTAQGAAGIAESGAINSSSGIYATTGTAAGTMTGNTVPVVISETTAGAFTPVTGAGPWTGYMSGAGFQTAGSGSLSLATGVVEGGGVITSGVIHTSVDVAAGVVIGTATQASIGPDYPAGNENNSGVGGHPGNSHGGVNSGGCP